MPMWENLKTIISPDVIDFAEMFLAKVDVVLSCASDQLMKLNALAVRGRLNVLVSTSPITRIDSLITQHTNAAHHGHGSSAGSTVAALYLLTCGPQFVLPTSVVPISSEAI